MAQRRARPGTSIRAVVIRHPEAKQLGDAVSIYPAAQINGRKFFHGETVQVTERELNTLQSLGVIA